MTEPFSWTILLRGVPTIRGMPTYFKDLSTKYVPLMAFLAVGALIFFWFSLDME